MPEAVPLLSRLLTGWLGAYMLHSTVAIGSTWLVVRLGIIRSSATRDLLWKLALVVPVLAATLAVARPGIAVRELELHRVVRPAPDALETESLRGIRPASNVEGVGSFRLRRWDRRAPVSEAEWTWLLLPVWLVGAGLGLGLEVRSRRATRSDLGPLNPPGPRATRALVGVTRGIRRRLRVVTSPTASSPCVVGTLVVLPDRCEVDLSDGELEAVLSHELAHVVRRDAGWLVLFAVLGRAMWVQPLNRLAREGFLEAADLECDDWSVARTRRPLELARSISRVAEWTLATGGARRGKALALGRGRRLSRRVSRILAGRRPARGPRWIRFAAAAVVLAPTLLLPAVPLAGARQAVVVRVEVTRGAPVAGVEDGETRTVSLRRIRRP